MTEMTYICDPGCNWVGDMSLLKRIAYECKKAGATYLKPQLFDAQLLYTEKDNPYYDIQQRCSMTLEQAEEIYEYCQKIKLGCIFSCFDMNRLHWVNDMGIDTVKIALRMAGDMDFLNKIKDYAMYPIITLSDTYHHLTVNEYDNIFGRDKYQLLVGSGKYPSLIKDYDLSTIKLYKGLSNHIPDIYLDIAATAVGCQVIEHHVYHTYVYNPDILSSISITQLKKMIEVCNEITKIK